MVKVGRPAAGTVQGVSATPEGAATIDGLPCHGGHFLQAGHGRGLRAGDFEAIDHAGHAAAFVTLPGSGAGDVVGRQHRGGADILHLDHLAGHIEVHDVAAVIAVEAQHAGAAMSRADGVRHQIHAWRGKHVADGAGIQKTRLPRNP